MIDLVLQTARHMPVVSRILLVAAFFECLSVLFPNVQGLAEAKETGDSQKFTDAVAEYDSLTRLDAWKTQLLLCVKKRLSAVAEGEEEDLT